jgi:hypothetical protein
MNLTISAPSINPPNTELNLICHLLALLEAHHILHVSRIRVKNLSSYLTNNKICLLYKNWPFIALHRNNPNVRIKKKTKVFCGQTAEFLNGTACGTYNIC